MEIKRLAPGQVAPKDSDCIKISRGPDGRFELVTSALLQCDGSDEASSEAVISSDEYDTYTLAEEAGLAWAEGHCVDLIFVETD